MCSVDRRDQRRKKLGAVLQQRSRLPETGSTRERIFFSGGHVRSSGGLSLAVSAACRKCGARRCRVDMR